MDQLEIGFPHFDGHFFGAQRLAGQGKTLKDLKIHGQHRRLQYRSSAPCWEPRSWLEAGWWFQRCSFGDFRSHGGSPEWTIKKKGKSPSKMDDFLGYHYFRKPPFTQKGDDDLQQRVFFWQGTKRYCGWIGLCDILKPGGLRVGLFRFLVNPPMLNCMPAVLNERS